MPLDNKPLASKAKQAAVLCQRLNAVRSVEEKRVYAERLDELWPDIRCRVNDEGHLCVYFLAERVQKVPKMLGFTAHYIEMVHRNGTATVTKDKVADRAGTTNEAGIELEVFDTRFELSEPRTAWERILDDDF